MTLPDQPRPARRSLGVAAALCVAGLFAAACASVTEPEDNAGGTVGGRTIVYGRVTDAQGAGLTNVRVTVRHHTAQCAGRINETEAVNTAADGRYRVVLTAVTAVGCVSVKAQPVSLEAIAADSVMNVRAPFQLAEPLDSVAVNLTLRGGGLQ